MLVNVGDNIIVRMEQVNTIPRIVFCKFCTSVLKHGKASVTRAFISLTKCTPCLIFAKIAKISDIRENSEKC